MPRSMWKGHISFGLVNIPVALYSGENRKSALDFTLLDRRDHAPIGYRKVNKSTGEEVPRDEIVKGYEFEKGRFVIVEDEDFKRAAPEATQLIDVVAFVDARDVEEMYYEKPYFLEPTGKAGAKGYAILREALVNTGKIAIAKIVIRSREYLAALIPKGKLLLLDMLRFGHELNDPSQLYLKLAERLIEEMSDTWDPSQFKDEYHEKLREFIERKAREGAAVEAPAAEAEIRETPMHDLMSLLKESVEKAGKKGRKTRTA
jgi:DNA end-binding protein Ku